MQAPLIRGLSSSGMFGSLPPAPNVRLSHRILGALSLPAAISSEDRSSGRSHNGTLWSPQWNQSVFSRTIHGRRVQVFTSPPTDRKLRDAGELVHWLAFLLTVCLVPQ